MVGRGRCSRKGWSTVECGYAGIWGRGAVLVGFISLMFGVVARSGWV